MNVKQWKTYQLLLEFTQICEKNNLKYSLFFGSMLGAIRHKGFIPWDDDLDIVVPIQTFDFFIKNHNKQFLHNDNSNNFLLFAKYTNDSENDPDATFIDVFVVVKTDNHKLKKYSSITNKVRYLHNYTHRNLFKRQWGMKLVKFFFAWTWLFKKITFKQMYSLLNNPHGDLYHVLSWPFKSQIKTGTYQNINFDNLIEVDFENTKVKVFANYEDILISTYGKKWATPIKKLISKHLGMYDMDVFTFRQRKNQNEK
ncbi:lipopolysaccharide cholinephosphotransferase [Mycoplasmopsis phocirhinis]|uniref:Lipopolysaccharide cholinephosphotransferase n=1 Tax=Mycoplasmopsis phocirhinis TaxID=142650 RepID=A0A4P6MP66_9BACT|nr:LicD family protein [Mycoplasmopsis phocirhinis]QBF34670.1 lipopolysaccharide cholinephosphotransferase [Mycoplasmopsis phocirhinis]